MSGGIYSALSGMQVRLDDLDRVASDLANVSTSGYKVGALVHERGGARRLRSRARLGDRRDVRKARRSTSAAAP